MSPGGDPEAEWGESEMESHKESRRILKGFVNLVRRNH